MVKAWRLVLMCGVLMPIFFAVNADPRAYVFGILYGAHVRLARQVSPWTGALVYCLGVLAEQLSLRQQASDVLKGVGTGVVGTWAVQWARRKMEEYKRKKRQPTPRLWCPRTLSLSKGPPHSIRVAAQLYSGRTATKKLLAKNPYFCYN